jgi:phosphoglycolate phosphatase
MPGSSDPLICSVALIDLDGTIIDSAPIITATIAASLASLDLPVPGPEVLIRLVGPPIMIGFQDVLGLDPGTAAALLDAYRRRYATEVYATPVFPGIADALDRLTQPLAIATSKPWPLATSILERLGLADRFVAICGAEPDDTGSTKAEVVQKALDALRTAGCDTSRPVMIGDRFHDIEGAAVHGVPAVFAAWGYGDAAESAGAAAIATRPADVPRLLGLPPTVGTASI